MSAREAMKLALEAELDLVKIAPTAKPPVCKIIDYGKYKYEQSKKRKRGQEKTKDGGSEGSASFTKHRYERFEYKGK